MNTRKELIESLGKIFGASFVSLKNYESSTSGEIANHVINVGADYANAVKKDIEKLSEVFYKDEIYEQARVKMLDSLKKNMDSETVSNQSIAQKDAYLHINKSVKLHIENGTLHISGMACSKKVIKEATKHKNPSKNPVIIAQGRIQKELNLSTPKWRNYKFENLNIVNTGGNSFELGTSNGAIETKETE